MKYFLVAAAEFCSELVFALPRFRSLNWLKGRYLSMFGARVGKRVVFYRGVWIFPGRNLVVGDDVDFAKGVLVTTGGGVTIGDRVLIGYGAKILSANHVIPPKKGQIFCSGHEMQRVEIGADSWIGANAIILPGVTVGEGAVVAAGSVVSRSVAPFTIVGGVPAKLIKTRI